MIIKPCIRLCWYLLLWLFASHTFANNAQTSSTQELSVLLASYTAVSGEFTQTLIDESNTLIQDSNGRFTVKKPGYFHWETIAPFPQLLVSNLETIWLYDPDLEQVTVRPYAGNVDDTPALLLSGDADKIAARYSVVKPNKNEQRFVLTPLATGGTFTELQVLFENSALKQMQLQDSLQQVTTFTFTRLQLDPSISDSLFEFTPPEGVDILINE